MEPLYFAGGTLAATRSTTLQASEDIVIGSVEARSVRDESIKGNAASAKRATRAAAPPAASSPARISRSRAGTTPPCKAALDAQANLTLHTAGDLNLQAATETLDRSVLSHTVRADLKFEEHQGRKS